MQTGYWDLYEVEKGEFRLTGKSARTLAKGARKPIADMQARVDAKWSTYQAPC